MPTAYLSRTVRFDAMHRYFRPEWAAAKNADVFGSSASLHAHAYQCVVTVRGTMDPQTGMVLDLGALDRILAEEVVARFDHRNITLDVPEFAAGGALPTGEELCVDIWRRVAARLPAPCSLALVRVQEDPTLYAEYRGEA